jgi:hypothetical protein
MTYLTQSLRNAYDTRDRDALERLLVKVEALEKRPAQPPVQPEPNPVAGQDAGCNHNTAV